MLSRENGKLKLDSLDMEIFIGDLFAKCNKEKEINWLEEQLQSMIEYLAEERMNEIF